MPRLSGLVRRHPCPRLLQFRRHSHLAKMAGCTFTQRHFDNWSAHQNWALSHLDFKYPWLLYLDADERATKELCEQAFKVAVADSAVSAYRIRRRDFFSDGSWLKHAQISPYFLRLFRPAKMRYERLVNPVSIVDGPIGEITGYLDHFPFSKGVGFWLERHIKYAEFEAQMIAENRAGGGRLSIAKAFFARDFSTRRFHQKELFYHLPFRPCLKLLYMLLVRRAFLDGRAGITYAGLQSIYEYFIVLRQREIEPSKHH